MIINPILPGFNPDPCICRKGDDYYMAVSTFEWFPGIPVYHSKDLKNWELYTHVITDDEKVDLKKLPSAKGIWAPCLTYCEEEDMFYVVYGVMNSMNARYFDVDNFLICAKDIRGPWSEPVYLHSSGFDASLSTIQTAKNMWYHWSGRQEKGYEKPGAICMVEYSPEKKEDHRLSEADMERRYRPWLHRSTAPYKTRRVLLHHVCRGWNWIQSLCYHGTFRKCLGTI